ncbi:MAG TPA: hypothetical protein VJY62_06500 [Bacteroidia bacterium]|nr:hypothetical protein [Bacteroidia bacterium]
MNDLRQDLDAIQKDVEDNPYFNFTTIATIHFARFVILEEERDSFGKIIYPAYLAFETNYDGKLDDHLKDIVEHTKLNNGFDKVFCACKTFPGKDVITDTDRINFLKTNSQFNPYFYRGTWGRTVLQIKAEEETRNKIQSHLDKNPHQGFSERDMYKRLKEDVKPSFYNTEHPPKLSSLLWRLSPIILLVLFCLLYTLVYGLYFVLCLIQSWYLIVILPLTLHFLIIGVIVTLALTASVYYIILRHKEKTDKELKIFYDPNPDTISLKTVEDRIVQNQLTHLVELKPGSFRLFTLKMVLFLIETFGIYHFNKGNLGGIPSIHFARWIIIDKGKRLLFFSNYDGSWENYLGDFIDRAAVGLTAVWSNTKLFPKSKNLIFEGAVDEQKFKSWTRMHQIPTQVWYSAYKYLTVGNINNNTALQDGLKKQTVMTDKKLKEWLLKI